MKKLLAIVVTVALTISTMSMVAFADPTEIATVTVKGVAVEPGGSALTAAIVIASSDIDDIDSFTLELTRDVIDSDEPVIEFTGDAKTLEVWRLTAAEDATVLKNIEDGEDNFEGMDEVVGASGVQAVATAHSSAITPTTDVDPLEPGDVLWLLEPESGSEAAYRIVISQKTGGNIGGDSTVVSPQVNVVLPLDLDFVIDPLQVKAGGDNQISNADYRIVNKTEGAPVKVSFNLTAVPKDADVILVDDKEDLDADNAVDPDKSVFFAILGANEVDGSNGGDPEFADPSLGDMVFDATEVGTLFPFDAAEKKSSISFILDSTTEASEGQGYDTLAADNAGVSSFQFYGELNTYADWQPNDLSVTGSYKLLAMKTSAVTNLEPGDLVGLNIVNVNTEPEDQEPDHDVKLESSTPVNFTVARSKYPSPGLKVYIPAKPDGITSVSSGTTAYTATTDYTYDSTTGLLTITRVTGSSNASMPIVAGGVTYTLDLTVTG